MKTFLILRFYEHIELSKLWQHMQLVQGVFIKRSVPQIMYWIEFFKEYGLDDERGKEYAKKFEENRYFASYLLSNPFILKFLLTSRALGWSEENIKTFGESFYF